MADRLWSATGIMTQYKKDVKEAELGELLVVDLRTNPSLCPV
jgi:hypothetical protein